jgi:hypothetical protein
MAPKWILQSTTVVGMLILVLTNAIQQYADAFPPGVVVAINIILPSLIMLKKYLTEQATGSPPVQLLPPTKEDKVASLVEQKAIVETELVKVKAA